MVLRSEKMTTERFPCNDEQKENKKIVEEINKKNERLYGKLCKKCDLFKKWCRCKVNKLKDEKTH